MLLPAGLRGEEARDVALLGSSERELVDDERGVRRRTGVAGPQWAWRSSGCRGWTWPSAGQWRPKEEGQREQQKADAGLAWRTGGRERGGARRSRMDAGAAMGCSDRAHKVKASQQLLLQETVRGPAEDTGRGGRIWQPRRPAAAVALWPSGEQRAGAAAVHDPCERRAVGHDGIRKGRSSGIAGERRRRSGEVAQRRASGRGRGGRRPRRRRSCGRPAAEDREPLPIENRMEVGFEQVRLCVMRGVERALTRGEAEGKGPWRRRGVLLLQISSR